jgi:hypothetical protein
VVEIGTQKAVTDVEVSLFFSDSSKIEEDAFGRTNSKGKIGKYISQNNLDRLISYSVSGGSEYKDIYPPRKINKTRLNDLMDIKLNPQ